MYLVEAYSRFTADYDVIGVFVDRNALILALHKMDPVNRRRVRISILAEDVIAGKAGRIYLNAKEFAPHLTGE